MVGITDGRGGLRNVTKNVEVKPVNKSESEIKTRISEIQSEVEQNTDKEV